MNCKYAIVPTETINGKHYLQCSITNNQCPLVRYCSRVDDIINIDNIEQKCNIYKYKGVSTMPNGQYKVLFEKRGLLYVELDSNTVVQVKNQSDSILQSVDLIKVKDEYYIKGFEPKPIKSKSKIESEV